MLLAQGDCRRGLERLEELLLRLLTSGKERMPVKRAEYFLTMARLCQVMDAAATRDQESLDDLKFIEELCDKAAAESDPG